MRRKNSIYYRWIASYLIIFSFPLLINTYLYRHNLSTLRQEVINSNRVIVENAQQNIDNIFQEADRLITQISLNNTVREVLKKDEVDPGTLISMREVMENLSSYRQTNHYISSFYLYCKKTDTVISPGYMLNRTDFLNMDLQVSPVDYRNMTNTLLNSSNSHAFFINTQSSGTARETFVITQSIPLVSEESSGVVVILLDKEKLLANFDFENNSGFYISNRNSNVLPIRALDTDIDIERLILFSGDKPYETHENIHIIKTRSSTTGWLYISAVEDSLIVDKLAQTKTITFVSLFVYIILGGFISLSLLRYNYKPFEKLIDAIEQKTGSRYNRSVHEYAFIEDTVGKISGRQAELRSHIRQQDDILKKNLLNRILKDGASSTTEENLMRCGIEVVSDRVLAGLIHFSSLTELFRGENLSESEIYNYAVLIVSNITEEFLAPLGSVFFTTIDNSVAFGIILKEENDDRVFEGVKEAVNSSGSFISENFHFTFYTAVSNIHSFSSGIHIAYQEALTCMEYKNVNPDEMLLLYKSLKLSKTSDYYYSAARENQLINLIKTGDSEAASHLIHQIFDDCREAGMVAPNLLKVLIYDIIGTLIRTITEIYDEESSYINEIMPSIDKLSACQDAEEFKKAIASTLAPICEHVPQKAAKSIGETVQAYILENYHNPMLSVSMIAANFNMHPNYLSTIFKEQMGFNILEYITGVRIDTAKRLLKENELTIDKIALSVGYTNSHTFTRTFKKLEKITPSSYRKAHMQ